MAKVKQKIAGIFRSIGIEEAFTHIRGYIYYVRKNGLNVYYQY
ncbi:MAG: hypothetical protein ACRCW0_05445 [Clostridium sp.]